MPVAAATASLLMGLSSALLITAVVSSNSRQLANTNDHLSRAYVEQSEFRQVAQRAERETRDALLDVKRQSAQLAIKHASTLFEQRQPSDGLLWIGRAAELAPVGDEALQRYIKLNLGGWLNNSCPITSINEFSGLSHDLNYSPDGRLLAIATGSYSMPNTPMVTLRTDRPPSYHAVEHGELGIVQLFDAESGEQLAALDHDQSVSLIEFSPDSSIIATGSGWKLGEGALRFWDVATRKPLGESIGHPGQVFRAVLVTPGIDCSPHATLRVNHSRMTASHSIHCAVRCAAFVR